MIQRIKIAGYKSLSTEAIKAVLFGPNTVGKSRFLDALQLLSRIVTSRTLKEAFEPRTEELPRSRFLSATKAWPDI
jgi:AAA15 family ATPase/GTPase